MATHIVDETPASFAPALKATLCELLAQAPAELLTGVRKIILLTSVTDPVLHASGNVSSQYLYKDGAAIIHIYLANIDRKRWRLIPVVAAMESRSGTDRSLVLSVGTPEKPRQAGEQRTSPE